jgi:hypothetical protein
MTRRYPERPHRRGATLVLVAVLLLGLIAVPALVIDLGALFTARAEAQRAADAAALAGASAWLDHPPEIAASFAEDRALEYGQRNQIRNVALQDDEVDVSITPESFRVRVDVRRTGLPTRFARFFGVTEMAVSASATAEAVPATSARCLKPFAVPDLWHDADDDLNANRIWDPGENWEYDPDQGDHYQRYTAGTAWNETGYGSTWRDPTDPSGIQGDYGRQLSIKYTDPSSEFAPSPGIFLPWRLPPDPDMEACEGMSGGGGPQGASGFRNNICACNQSPIELGVDYDLEPGNMVGPTAQGVSNLIDQDPWAHWDPMADGGRGGVAQSEWGDDWMMSPRIVKIALFEPGQISGSGMQSVRFNNFALLFLESQPNQRSPVTGRFLYYVTGDDDEGNLPGSLALFVRLVE